MEKVTEVTLTINDLRHLEEFLTTSCALDSLDIMEILTEIEKLKNVSIKI